MKETYRMHAYHYITSLYNFVTNWFDTDNIIDAVDKVFGILVNRQRSNMVLLELLLLVLISLLSGIIMRTALEKLVVVKMSFEFINGLCLLAFLICLRLVIE